MDSKLTDQANIRFLLVTANTGTVFEKVEDICSYLAAFFLLRLNMFTFIF